VNILGSRDASCLLPPRRSGTGRRKTAHALRGPADDDQQAVGNEDDGQGQHYNDGGSAGNEPEVRRQTAGEARKAPGAVGAVCDQKPAGRASTGRLMAASPVMSPTVAPLPHMPERGGLCGDDVNRRARAGRQQEGSNRCAGLRRRAVTSVPLRPAPR
jgi:hypothetical protein